MSYDEDFPYAAEDRRKFRTQVGVSIVAVLVGVGILVMKCSNELERKRDIHNQMALNQAIRDYNALPPRADLPPEGDEAAIELELLRTSARHDVTGSLIILDDRRTIEVAPRAAWTYSDDTLSLSYSSALRITKGEEGSLILGGGDALAEIGILETDETEAQGLAALVQTYESTGQVAASEDTTIKLLGKTVDAKRIVTSGPVAEVAAIAAGKGKQLRVIITATSVSADPSVVRKAVETITLAKRPATPELDVTLRSPTGDTIATAAATIGAPFDLGGESMTVARRATVREQLNGMRFEHPPGLAVTTVSGAAPAVSLRAGTLGIQVMAAPFSISSDELAQAMGVQVSAAKPITRTVANATYRGIAGDFQMGELGLYTQAFSFERGGRTFIVMIQSPKADAERALALADPIMASVQ